MHTYKYYAFISYSHKDEEWAKWLQHEFEHYHLPSTLNGREGLPCEFRPIFRDIDELSGGELKPQISEALANSANLIVICSPNSAKSVYVSGEIREFVELGRQQGVNRIARIYPFIVSGVPHAKDNPDEECFPPALMELPTELIAGDATRHGREQAFVKILAGTLRASNVDFSMLWNQFERDRIEEERRKREERNRLQLLESRYLSEKANELTDGNDSYLARVLALQALPLDMTSMDDRPYCTEAEYALRKACYYDGCVIKADTDGICAMAISPDNERLYAYDGRKLLIWDMLTGIKIKEIPYSLVEPVGVAFSPDCESILSVGENMNTSDLEIRLFNFITEKKSLCPDGWGSNYMGSCAAFNSSGSKIATIDCDKSVRIWDPESWIQTGHLMTGTDGGLCSVCFSHDDRMVASVAESGAIYLWNAETGKLQGTYYDADNTAEMWTCFSPDGMRLAYTTHYGSVALVNTGTMTCTGIQFDGNIGAFSPDGRYLAISKGSDVSLYDVCSGERIGEPMTGNMSGIDYLLYCPDGSRIVAGSRDGNIRIWNVDKYLTPVKRVVTATVNYAEFSPDGSKIITASDDCTVRLWDSLTGHPVDVNEELMNLLSNIKCASFSPDGRKLAVIQNYSREVRIFSGKKYMDCKVIRFQGTDWYSHVRYAPDAKSLVMCSPYGTVGWMNCRSKAISHEVDLAESGWSQDAAEFPVSVAHDVSKIAGICQGENFLEDKVGVWNTMTGELIAHSQGLGPLTSVAVSQDGSKIAGVTSDSVVILDGMCQSVLSNPIDVHGLNIIGVRFSLDGKYLVSASEAGDISVWETDGGKCVNSIPNAHSGTITSLAFRPDGTAFVSTSADGTAKIWDSETGHQIGHTLHGHGCSIFSAALSHDAKTVAVVYSHEYALDLDDERYYDCDGIKVFDTGCDRIIDLEFNNQDTDYSKIKRVCFSPDDGFIAAATGYYIYIWNAVTGYLETELESDDKIEDIRFSKDSKLIASVKGETVVDAWSIETEELASGDIDLENHDDIDVRFDTSIEIIDKSADDVVVRKFSGHDNLVISVNFSPDWRYLVSASLDKTVRVWDVASGKLASAPFVYDEEMVYAAFVSGGHEIIVISKRGLVETIKWISLQELMDAMRLRFQNRTLTLEEKQRFYLD